MSTVNNKGNKKTVAIIDFEQVIVCFDSTQLYGGNND